MKNAIADRVREFGSEKRVSVGFDGYIDRILRVGRHNDNGTSDIDTMTQFGAYILEKAGKSCSLELRLVEEKIGGNMPNYAHCLARLGIGVDCVGALGWPSVHPLFAQGLEGCGLYSVCQPGLCDALEFNDGKVMLAQNREIEALDYAAMTQRIEPEKAADLFVEADMLAFLNWSEMKGATSIWEGMGREILPRLTQSGAPMLVDFSDCSGKSREEVEKIAQVLSGYREKLRIILSLNLNEAEQLALKLGLAITSPSELARRLYGCFEPEVLVIHLTDGCVYYSKDKNGHVPNHVVNSPKILTGGGDNFNAGLTFGILAGMELENALLLGNIVSGYYVSNGHSPDRAQLTDWLERYHTTGGSI